MNSMSLHLPLVEKLESHIGKKMPSGFRNWMLDEDAPYPAPAEVSIPGSSSWIDRVDRLFAAEEIFHAFVEDEALSQSCAHRFPRDMLVIGDNQSGGYFLLSLREDFWGAVFYMFHETAKISGTDIAGLHFVSASFTDWIGSLVSLGEEEDAEEE